MRTVGGCSSGIAMRIREAALARFEYRNREIALLCRDEVSREFGQPEQQMTRREKRIDTRRTRGAAGTVDRAD
jgi:hypothetical protein